MTATSESQIYVHELVNAINKIKNDTLRITEGRIEKRGNSTDIVQLYHIIDEIIETKLELENKPKRPDKEVDESLDILFAVIAWFHHRKYSDDEILFGVKRSIEKFKKRGWLPS